MVDVDVKLLPPDLLLARTAGAWELGNGDPVDFQHRSGRPGVMTWCRRSS